MDMVSSEDVLIDWTRPMYMNFTHIDIMNRMEKFFSSKVNGILDCRIYGDIFICKTLPDLELEPLPADEVVMRQLSKADVQTIHVLYPACDIESVEVFDRLITRMPGYGMFSVPKDELAAWMVQSYYGAMFSMQTKPEFRRKG